MARDAVAVEREEVDAVGFAEIAALLVVRAAELAEEVRRDERAAVEADVLPVVAEVEFRARGEDGLRALVLQVGKRRDELLEERLADQKRDLLASITRGLSNDDIAKLLGISTSAVKQRLTVLFAKLGAASRSEAVAIALRKQLLKA